MVFFFFLYIIPHFLFGADFWPPPCMAPPPPFSGKTGFFHSGRLPFVPATVYAHRARRAIRNCSGASGPANAIEFLFACKEDSALGSAPLPQSLQRSCLRMRTAAIWHATEKAGDIWLQPLRRRKLRMKPACVTSQTVPCKCCRHP